MNDVIFFFIALVHLPRLDYDLYLMLTPHGIGEAGPNSIFRVNLV